MTNIPLYFVNEAQDAFPLWMQAVRTGLFSAPACLVRFSRIGGLAGFPLLQGEKNILEDGTEGAEFLEQELLGSDTYLLLALHRRIFREVLWTRGRPQQASSKNSFTFSDNAGELSIQPLESEGCDSTSSFVLHEVGPEIEIFQGFSPACVEIHLSYFSAQNKPQAEGARIEITKAAAEDFKKNPYHVLRLFSGAKVSVIEENEKCFLEYRSSYFPVAQTSRSDAEEITQSIGFVTRAITAFRNRPSCIILSRDKFSGKVPRDQAERIESELLNALSQECSFTIQTGDI